MNVLGDKKQQLLIGSGIFICITIIGVFFIWYKQKENSTWETLPSSSSSEMVSKQSESQSATITVDIKGEVVRPGVYELPHDARMQKLVQMACGFTKKAQQKEINLAQKLQDQQMIYVPNHKEISPKNIGDSSTLNEIKDGTNDNTEKVNINAADLTQLQTLSGIGIKKAEAIIAYREENGNFKSIDELKEVSGIGEKTVEKLRASITI